MEAAAQPWPALGVLILRDGLVTKEELESVLDEQVDHRQQRISSRRLGEILVERGMVTETQVAQLVAEQYELPFVDLHVADIDLEVAHLLDEGLARRYAAVAVGTRSDGCHLVAIADPSAVLFSEEIRSALGGHPTFVVVGQAAIDAALDFVYTQEHEPSPEPAPGDEAEMGIVLELPAPSPDLGPRSDTQRWPPLGALLVRDGLVTETDLEAALAQQRLSSSMRLGEILVERGAVTPADVARLVAEQYELPFVDLAGLEVDRDVVALLDEKIGRRRLALPIDRLPDGTVRVVVADPTNVFQSDELRSALGTSLSFCVAAPEQIADAIETAHGAAPTEGTQTQEHWAMPEPEVEPAERVPEEEPTMDAPLDVPDEEEHRAAELHVPDVEIAPAVAEIADSFERRADLLVEDPPAPEPLTDEPPVQTTSDAGPDEEHEEPSTEAPDPAEDVQLDEELLAEVGETVAVAAAAPDEPSEHEPDPGAGLVDEIDETVRRALALGATTIQLTPRPDGLAVRARIGRTMQELATFPAPVGTSASRNVAERAGVDPETRSPRRGVLAVTHDERSVSLEVSTLPTKLGLQVSLRVLEATGSRRWLTDLGMPATAEAELREALRKPSGVVLVCGPALSGRTTTLYAALQELTSPERALGTVEDPVERLLPGVDQVDVDAASGVTFPAALRAILRTGADTVLVGELREPETAQVAFRGARSDRLVLTALEALTASAALERLTGELAVEPQLVTSTLSCVVAQHLVRRICVECRESYYASADEIAELGRPDEESGRRLLARGRGCPSCAGTGFAGWAGVFETLPLTDEVRVLVEQGARASALREAAVAAGMSTLRDGAIGLCLDGVTSVSEVRQVPRG